MSLLADTPRSDFFGAAYSDVTGALIVMGSNITFHDGSTMTLHNGQPWQFHDPVSPDQQLFEGRSNSVPRSEFAGEADT